MANIVVTGAGKGIGYELVKLLTENGHQVVAVSRNLEKVKQNIPGAYCFETDLTQLNRQVFSAFVLEKLGVVDVLINNAGAILNKPFGEITLAEMQYTYNVNVFAVAGTIQTLLPLIKKQGEGHIINISSMGGYMGSAKFPGLSIYSSSKGALSILSECLAEEFREIGVKVNALCLGAVQTEMLSTAFPGYVAPLSPVEMARFIGDFALTAHHYMNGKCLPVSLSTP